MPARSQGFTIFMTGLSGAGKSTIAERLSEVIEQRYRRPVTVLDGDIVREMLSSGLTFSRIDRELNIRRIGYVASEVTKHGGICICAAIAPFISARAEARARIQRYGRFYEVYISTPLEVCEKRDPKGLYRKARRGEIHGFTGIDDPFEAPASPELVIDTSRLQLDDEIEKIVALTRRDGVL
ncbi:MAG: adenylyl-sulfate kinase [Gammaproteobacteria bacterium]|nr:adenylyl-sulfate kinase [Gammaproteobacteria bacterium]